MARKPKGKISDQEQLELFVRRVQELVDTRLFRSNQLFNYQPKLAIVQGQPISVEAQNPDEDDLKSFLVTFRHFTMKDEPTYFYHVCNTAYMRFTPSQATERDKLADARKIWQAAEKGAEVFIVDGKRLNPTEIYDMYINGLYFHNDPNYVKKLYTLQNLPVPFLQMRFFLTLQDFTNIIIQVGNHVGYGLKHGWFDFS